MARTVARTVERSRAVRCRALSLVLVCTSCVSTMATGTDEQTLLLRARCISADSWGAGLPSFWCVELPQIGERRQFIVREEHALQFGAEFPECAGGHILSVGRTTYKGTDEAKLVEAQPPAGYVRNTQAARPERFVNERVKMTEVGKRDLARGVRKNQIVWGRRYRCGGINTYRCVSDTTLNTSPCASAQTIGRGLTAGTTVVATDTKVLNDKRWIQIGRAWACYKLISFRDSLSETRVAIPMRQGKSS